MRVRVDNNSPLRRQSVAVFNVSETRKKSLPSEAMEASRRAARVARAVTSPMRASLSRHRYFGFGRGYGYRCVWIACEKDLGRTRGATT
eukprot:3065519-Pleurochrysis_carterae.AAC.1